MAGATLVGVVPGLAGVMRVVSDLDEHEDEGFAVPMRQLRTSFWRDLPISLLAVVATVMTGVNLWALLQVDARTRAGVVGFLVPVVWAVVVFLCAYVAAAATVAMDAPRSQVLGMTAMIVRARPLRALVTPVLLIGMAPVIVLPPLTVACGVSIPSWLFAEWLGVPHWRERLELTAEAEMGPKPVSPWDVESPRRSVPRQRPGTETHG